MAPDPSLAAGNGPKGNNPVVRITPGSDTADALGQTIQLTANATNPTWTSLSPGVVTVDALGRVVSVGTGLGFIEATVGRKADTAEVLVRQIPASLTVTPDTFHYIFGNDPQGLTAVVADANGFPVSPLLGHHVDRYSWPVDRAAEQLGTAQPRRLRASRNGWYHIARVSRPVFVFCRLGW